MLAVTSLVCMAICHYFVSVSDSVFVVIFGVSALALIAVASAKAIKISNSEQNSKED